MRKGRGGEEAVGGGCRYGRHGERERGRVRGGKSREGKNERYMYNVYVEIYMYMFVCLTLLASFFLPSHLSFKNMYISLYIHACTCIYGGRN